MPVNFPAPEGGYEKVGKQVGVLGQNAEYYLWEITLLENQSWMSDVINIKGKSIIALYLWNYSAPGALGTSGVRICLADGTKSAFLGGGMSGAPAAGGTLTGWLPSPSQYLRVAVVSGSTAGTYTVRVWFAVYPM